MIATPHASSLLVAARYSAPVWALLLGACPPPGQGSKAEAGYRRAAPVIVALDRYHQERGSYPETLAELPPGSLAAPASGQPLGLQYKLRGEHYELSFSYAGPGVNHCSYDSSAAEPQRWKCRGYY